MKYDWFDFMIQGFIDELDMTMDFYADRQDLKTKEFVDKQIEEKIKWFENEKAKVVDDEVYLQDLIDQFQEFATFQRFRQYNELSSYFQKVYARFENQIASFQNLLTAKKKLNKECSLSGRIDFSKYQKVQEFNWAVNVMKHAGGPSLKNLENCNSKYIQKPVEFSEMMDFYVSDKILNIEFSDIEEFIGEAKTVWKDIIKQNQDERQKKIEEKEREC